MPLLLGCLALSFPRIVLGLVWLFGGNYLGRAFPSFIFPLLGFFFLPLTTLAFALAANSFGTPTGITPFGWLLTGLALLGDLGLLGGTRRLGRNRQ